MDKKSGHTKKILIHPELNRELQNEFRTSWQTIDAAKNYYNNSTLAKKIRKRCKELLLEESKKVENYDWATRTSGGCASPGVV